MSKIETQKPKYSTIKSYLNEANNTEDTKIASMIYLRIITDILIEYGLQEGIIEDDRSTNSS